MTDTIDPKHLRIILAVRRLLGAARALVEAERALGRTPRRKRAARSSDATSGTKQMSGIRAKRNVEEADHGGRS